MAALPMLQKLHCCTMLVNVTKGVLSMTYAPARTPIFATLQMDAYFSIVGNPTSDRFPTFDKLSSLLCCPASVRIVLPRNRAKTETCILFTKAHNKTNGW